jgi:hypothetical protein
MLANVRRLFGVVLLLGLAFLPAVPSVYAGGRIGSTGGGDDVTYGQFAIANNTGATITYWVKWGQNGAWQRIDLSTGYYQTHSYALDNAGRAPVPYILFSTNQGSREYRLQFYAVGMAGGQPKFYDFGFASDGSRDLYVR